MTESQSATTPIPTDARRAFDDLTLGAADRAPRTRRLAAGALRLIGGRGWLRAVWRTSASTPWWPRAVAAATLLVLFAFEALGQLNALLKAMHLSGRAAVGVDDLTDVFGKFWAIDQYEIARIWREYDESVVGPASSDVALWLYFAIDTFAFAPALAFGLAVLARRLQDVIRRRHAATFTTEDRRLELRWRARGLDPARAFVAYQRLALWGALAALIYLIADVAENILVAIAVRVDVGTAGAIALWLATLLKLAFLVGGTVVPILLVARVVWLAFPADADQLRRLVRRLRVHVVLVGVFFVTLIAHEQLPDLIRRWELWQLLFSLAAVGYFALVIWLLTTELEWRMPKAPRWAEDPDTIFRAVVVVAVIQLAIYAIGRALAWERNVGWGLAIPLAFILVFALFGRILPKRDEPEIRPEASGFGSEFLPRVLAATVLTGFGLALFRASFGHAIYSEQLSSREVWEGGAVAAGIVAGAAFALVRPHAGALVAMMTLGAAVALAIVRWQTDRNELHASVLLAVSLVLPIVAWALYRGLHGDRLDTRPALWWTSATAAGAVVAVAGGLVVKAPWVTGEFAGGVALLAVFLAGAALVGGTLIWVADAVPPPRAFRILNLDKIPVLIMLVAWFALAAMIDSKGPHDVRLVPATTSTTPTTLARAWNCWLRKNGLGGGCRGATANATTKAAAATPLIFVATSGGATRAAFWTDTVLDCAFETKAGEGCNETARPDDFRRSNTIFMGSGISGGAVGLAFYSAQLADKAEARGRDDWVRRRLYRDFLSPTIGWALFVELPQTLLRFSVSTDRAEVLERSWERAWGEDEGPGMKRGLFETWFHRQEVPLMVYNGTSVEDGCRFNASVLDANVETKRTRASTAEFHDCRSSAPFDADGTGTRLKAESALPATRDLVDFLCSGQDVELSTAGLLSARFPYVSPTGRMQWCRSGSDRVTYVVDGGYLDTSGASAIVELWKNLEPKVLEFNTPSRCIVPFFIQIDNGYEDNAASKAAKRPFEVSAPGQTIVATRSARAAEAKAAAALEFSRPFGRSRLDARLLRNRYAHFAIQSHPGPKAPLGWTLSQVSMDVLRNQMKHPKNANALALVRSWLGGKLSCS